MNTLINITLDDYNSYRKSMIMALMRYSYYKPAKLDKQLAEDVFQDAFFKFHELLKSKESFIFKDYGVKESFIWRINRFTYLSMISCDNSKYKRGVPIYSYIEDLKGLVVTDYEDVEYEEDKTVNYNIVIGNLLKRISNKSHKLWYKEYIHGSTMKQISEKHSLNIRSLEQQINRINKKLELETGFKISKRGRK